jgi:glycosyltransferase involved in cell wall biosynthesis
MKASIITVARNAERTIADTIASVAAQDYSDIEHIIIDGASIDRTVDTIKAHAAGNVRWISETDTGIYEAMNKGIAMARGDLVGFLNADDYFCRRDAISLLIEGARAHPEADAICGGVAMINRQGKLRRYYPARGFMPWMLRFGHMPPHPGFYVRRTVFAALGLFDDRLKTGADFEWMLRFFYKHHLTAHFIGGTLVAFRMGGLSNSGLKSLVVINREAETSCKRHGIATHKGLMWTKYTLKSLQYILRPPDFPLSQWERWTPPGQTTDIEQETCLDSPESR